MRKNTLGKLLIAGSGISFCCQAYSAVFLIDFPEQKKEQWFAPYVSGAAAAFDTANIELAELGRPKLYCVPGKLSLNYTNYLQWIEESYGEARNDQALLKVALVDWVLLEKLKNNFPCKKVP